MSDITCGGCLYIKGNESNCYYHCSKSGYNISNTFERLDICKKEDWKITMENIKVMPYYENKADFVCKQSDVEDRIGGK